MGFSNTILLFAVVKSRDIPICNYLAKCWEIISLVYFSLLVFYIVRKTRKSVTSYLLMNINELNWCYCREFSSLNYLIFFEASIL